VGRPKLYEYPKRRQNRRQRPRRASQVYWTPTVWMDGPTRISSSATASPCQLRFSSGNGGIYSRPGPDLYFYPIISDSPDGPKAGERNASSPVSACNDRHELLNSFAWGPDGWALHDVPGRLHSVACEGSEKSNDPGVKMNANRRPLHTQTKNSSSSAMAISQSSGASTGKRCRQRLRPPPACVDPHLPRRPPAVSTSPGRPADDPYT